MKKMLHAFKEVLLRWQAKGHAKRLLGFRSNSDWKKGIDY